MTIKYEEKTDDIYSLFMYKMRKELKSQVDASVYVANDDDVLVVKINKGPFSFNYAITQFGPKLLGGLTVDAAVREVLDQYKSKVMGWFFYRYR